MLCRCLDSIPRRDDVQIIVVDDKSDPKQVDFKNFPGLNDKNVEVYFTKKGKGAGYARNVGLEHAKGKWVIFADADDWYLNNLSEMMDKYADSESDMIVFRTKRVDVDGNEINNEFDKYFDEVFINNNYDPIKYIYVPLWGKFIKRHLVAQNKIRFQEVKYSNDVMFALKVSSCCQVLKVVEDRIYCVYESPNSLTRNSDWRNPYIRVKVSIDALLYMRTLGKGYVLDGIWLFYWNCLWEISKFKALCTLFVNVFPRLGIQESWNIFKSLTKKNYPKYYKIIFRDDCRKDCNDE